MAEDKQNTAADSDEAGWQYRSASGAGVAAEGPDNGTGRASRSDNEDVVEWTASEFVHHDKSFTWYLLLGLAAIVVAAGMYFITRDKFTVVAILMMAIILGVAGSRKPRVMTYRLDSSGLTAGKKFYPYSEYKSFTMPDDGPFTSVMLTPLKRLSLPVGAFLAPDSQKKALDLLSSHLPLERGEQGLFDELMRFVRF